MDLVISTFGSRIRRKHEQIVVEIPNEAAPHMYPARRLERILIMGSSSISTDAVRLAMKHGVDISYIGAFGKPEARIVPAVPTGLTKVRHAQFRAAFTGVAFWYARQFVTAKVKSQIACAEALDRDPETIARMRAALDDALSAADVGTLLSAEGRAADRYFSVVWAHVFNGTGRDQRGGDRVNAALNYGYGILYNEAERAILHAGLDPFIGLLHTERYGKPSLTLDFVEEFRVAVVDTAVLPMFSEERFVSRDFIQKEEKVALSPYGRKKIVRRVFTRLRQSVSWADRTRIVSDIMTEQAQFLARSLLQDAPCYVPFVAPSGLYEESIVSDRDLVEKP